MVQNKNLKFNNFVNEYANQDSGTNEEFRNDFQGETVSIQSPLQSPKDHTGSESVE